MQATSVEWKTTAPTKKRQKGRKSPETDSGGPGFFGPLIDGFSTDSECRLGLRGNSNLSRF